MSQFPILSNIKPSYKIEDYFISKSNQEVFNWVSMWPKWPNYMRILNIYGSKLSGKTHLGEIWKKNANAKTIFQLKDFETFIEKEKHHTNFIFESFENDNMYEEKSLFYFINHLSSIDGYALILSKESVSRMNFHLPDLKSRLTSILTKEILLPDDELLKGILNKLFVDQQCLVSDKILNYLIKRVERNYEEVNNIVYNINKISLSKKSPVTISLVRSILKDNNL